MISLYNRARFYLCSVQAGGLVAKLEQAGVIKILSKQEIQPGCWRYEFTDLFTGSKFKKTEFPVSWNHQKIIDACWDTYENFTEATILEASKKPVRLKTVDHVDVITIFKAHEKTDVIYTAYPKGK